MWVFFHLMGINMAKWESQNLVWMMKEPIEKEDIFKHNFKQESHLCQLLFSFIVSDCENKTPKTWILFYFFFV